MSDHDDDDLDLVHTGFRARQSDLDMAERLVPFLQKKSVLGKSKKVTSSDVKREALRIGLYALLAAYEQDRSADSVIPSKRSER